MKIGTGEDLTVISGESGVRFLLISGRPLYESIAWYGPIVMNTQEELQTAFYKYTNGTFVKFRGENVSHSLTYCFVALFHADKWINAFHGITGNLPRQRRHSPPDYLIVLSRVDECIHPEDCFCPPYVYIEKQAPVARYSGYQARR